MKRALIGHTGFVGSTLRPAASWMGLYNSSNIETICGEAFDHVICAGVSAVKWLANKEPENDWRSIARLIEALSTVRAKRFTLISTIDIWQGCFPAFEDSVYPIKGDPYGLNRLRLEKWVAQNFEDHQIVRLPGLFGEGLKKNIIYDMMNCNRVNLIDPDSQLQWYPVRRLWDDLLALEGAGINIINVSPEPILTSEIADAAFPEVELLAQPGRKPVIYDMRTRYGSLLGGKGDYHIPKREVLLEIIKFGRSR